MFRGVRPALLASAAVSGPFPGPRAKMRRDGEKLQASDSIIPPPRFLSSKFFVPEEKSRPPGASAPSVRPCSRASCGHPAVPAGEPHAADGHGGAYRRPILINMLCPGPRRPSRDGRMAAVAWRLWTTKGFAPILPAVKHRPGRRPAKKESPAASRAWTRYPRMIPVYARIPPLVQVLFRVCFFFQHVRQHPAADLLRLHAAGL